MNAIWQKLSRVILMVMLPVSAVAVELGDPLEAVKLAMGPATGSMQLGDTLYLMYPRGTITLKEGVVTEVELETVEAYEHRIQEELRDRLEAADIQAALKQEGEALRDEILASKLYEAAPAGERVALWKKFQAKYPLVDILEAYAADLATYEQEVLLKQRLAEQERRIAQLEQRVQQAEQQAVRVRYEQPARVYYPVSYPVYTPPVISPACPRVTTRSQTGIRYHNPRSNSLVSSRDGTFRLTTSGRYAYQRSGTAVSVQVGR